MRSSLNATLLVGFAGVLSMAVACGDDTSTTGGTSGSGGSGGSGGSPATTSAGPGPSSSSGGPASTSVGSTSASTGSGPTSTASGSGGDPTGTGGDPTGTGGDPTGTGGDPTGTGGSPAGTGGSPAGTGGNGTGGDPTGTGGNGAGGGAPAGWNCNPDFYGDDDCDCGCGVFDALDCTDQTVASCEFCSNSGSCNPGLGCPGTIDPIDNAVCTAGTTTATSSSSTGGGACDVGEFECANGECVAGDFECDGFADCTDASDEGPTDATCECALQCDVNGDESGSSICIPDAYVCDGDVTDCVSGADEQNCSGNAFTLDSGVGAFPIPDNTPAGACFLIPSTATGTVASIDSIVISFTHTWVGDLFFEVQAPDDTFFSDIMDRPGFTGTGFGNSADAVAANPVTFQDGAATGAESLGTAVTVIPASTVFPEPDSLTTLVGAPASGDWVFCVSDSGSGDTGTINRVQISGTSQ